MSEFDINKLVDYSELSKAVNWMLAHINKQEAIINSQNKAQKLVENSIEDINSQLSEMKILNSRFSLGLTKIYKIDDMLSSWSERFKAIEESIFSTQNKIKLVEDRTEAQVEHLKTVQHEEAEYLKEYIPVEIEKKIKVSNSTVQTQIKVINEEIDNLRSEIIEQSNSELISVAGEIKDKESEKEKGNEDISKSLSKANTMLGISSKIVNLEAKINICMQLCNSGNHNSDFNSENVWARNEHYEGKEEEKIEEKIEEVKDFNELKRMIDATFMKAIKDMKKYKRFFDNFEVVAEDSGFRTDGTAHPEEEIKIDELASKIEKLKNMNLSSKFKELEKVQSGLMGQIQELILRNSEIERELKSIYSLHDNEKRELYNEPSNYNSQLKVVQTIEQSLNDHQLAINRIENDMAKIQKLNPHFLVRSEIDEMLKPMMKQIRDSRKHFKEPEDFNPRILEQEQRINTIWRSNTNLLEIIQAIEAKATGLEKLLFQLQESKAINVDFKIASIENELSDKIRAVRDSMNIVENIPHSAPMQNEKYFQGMMLEMRSDINSLKEENQKLKEQISDNPNIIGNTYNIEAIQEPIQIGLLQSILKQHDSAIRTLVNKSISRPSDDRPEKVENDAQLIHLEELKKELKEMLSNREENQRLSKNDVELIQNIAESIDTKIGKEELSQMADKTELKKIYRMLKKRIDTVAEVVNKDKEIRTRDQPFFSKRGQTLQCASCGRITSEKLEKKFTNQEGTSRFKMSSPSFVGISKILSSLIPNSQGRLILPSSSDPKQLEPLLSPKTHRVTLKKLF